MGRLADGHLVASVAASRARFGTPETLVASFPLNAIEKTCVELSGDLVRVVTRGPSEAYRADHEATAYELPIEHVALLIDGLIKALSAHASQTETKPARGLTHKGRHLT